MLVVVVTVVVVVTQNETCDEMTYINLSHCDAAALPTPARLTSNALDCGPGPSGRATLPPRLLLPASASLLRCPAL